MLIGNKFFQVNIYTLLTSWVEIVGFYKSIPGLIKLVKDTLKSRSLSFRKKFLYAWTMMGIWVEYEPQSFTWCLYTTPATYRSTLTFNLFCLEIEITWSNGEAVEEKAKEQVQWALDTPEEPFDWDGKYIDVYVDPRARASEHYHLMVLLESKEVDGYIESGEESIEVPLDTRVVEVFAYSKDLQYLKELLQHTYQQYDVVSCWQPEMEYPF